VYENDTAILNSCTALLFFGVPNRGINIDNLRTLVKDQKNEHFVHDLREGSELLRHVYQRFLQGFNLHDCEITSFYELRDTRAVVVRGGTWTRNGAMIRLVTQDSATYSLPTEASHMQIGIDADHSNMVKFTDNCDHHYITVRDRVSQCVGNAPSIIEARLASALAERNQGTYAKYRYTAEQRADAKGVLARWSLMLIHIYFALLFLLVFTTLPARPPHPSGGFWNGVDSPLDLNTTIMALFR